MACLPLFFWQHYKNNQFTISFCMLNCSACAIILWYNLTPPCLHTFRILIIVWILFIFFCPNCESHCPKKNKLLFVTFGGLLYYIHYGHWCVCISWHGFFLLFRMCRALMPGDEESMSDEAIWETLPVSLILVDLTAFGTISPLIWIAAHCSVKKKNFRLWLSLNQENLSCAIYWQFIWLFGNGMEHCICHKSTAKLNTED